MKVISHLHMVKCRGPANVHLLLFRGYQRTTRRCGMLQRIRNCSRPIPAPPISQGRGVWNGIRIFPWTSNTTFTVIGKFGGCLAAMHMWQSRALLSFSSTPGSAICTNPNCKFFYASVCASVCCAEQ